MLSAVALIGVAMAVFVRVRWHLKGRKTQPQGPEAQGATEAVQESSSHKG